MIDIVLAVALAAPASATATTLISQDRSVTASAAYTPSGFGDPITASETQVAPDFGPFAEDVSAGAAWAGANAGQSSTITSLAPGTDLFVSASGGASAQSWNMFGDAAFGNASGSSAFEITFELDTSKPFELSILLRGSTVPPLEPASLWGQMAASVTLLDGSGVVAQLSRASALGDPPFEFEERATFSGVLGPGLYVLRASAAGSAVSSYADTDYAAGDGHFEFQFSLVPEPAPVGLLLLGLGLLPRIEMRRRLRERRLRCRRSAVRAAVLGLALVLAAPAARATALFTGLGTGPGNIGTHAFGVSADGSVVVGEFAGGAGGAFRWTASGGTVSLGDNSFATAVSGDGTVVVGVDLSGDLGEEAFRWTEGTGMVGLGDLPGGDARSSAYAISADGSTIVGNSYSSSGTEAFRWTSSGGMVGLGGLPGEPIGSFAFGVSADGSVVVGSTEKALSSTESTAVAFLWTEAAGMLDLGRLPGAIADSEATAVTPDGSIVVGHSSTGVDGREAFRWTQASGMVGLGTLPGGSSSAAWAISADGSVVVGESTVDGGLADVAFIWDPVHGIRSLPDVLVDTYGLDLTGWNLTSAYGISADGLTIVGSGTNPSGQVEAWLVFLPEPTTGLLLAFGLAGLAGWRRPLA